MIANAISPTLSRKSLWQNLVLPIRFSPPSLWRGPTLEWLPTGQTLPQCTLAPWMAPLNAQAFTWMFCATMASRQILQRWARRAGEQLDGKMAHAPPGAHAHILKKGGWALRPVFPAAKNNESMCLLLMFYQVANCTDGPNQQPGNTCKHCPHHQQHRKRTTIGSIAPLLSVALHRHDETAKLSPMWSVLSLSLCFALSHSQREKSTSRIYLKQSFHTRSHTPISGAAVATSQACVRTHPLYISE